MFFFAHKCVCVCVCFNAPFFFFGAGHGKQIYDDIPSDEEDDPDDDNNDGRQHHHPYPEDKSATATSSSSSTSSPPSYQQQRRVTEALVPIDYAINGYITQESVLDNFLKPLRPGVVCTCLMDCSHGGNILELPYKFCPNQDDMERQLHNHTWKERKRHSQGKLLESLVWNVADSLQREHLHALQAEALRKQQQQEELLQKQHQQRSRNKKKRRKRIAASVQLVSAHRLSTMMMMMSNNNNNSNSSMSIHSSPSNEYDRPRQHPHHHHHHQDGSAIHTTTTTNNSNNSGGVGGFVSNVFLQVLQQTLLQQPRITNVNLLLRMQKSADDWIPQLVSSRPIDMYQDFEIVPTRIRSRVLKKQQEPLQKRALLISALEPIRRGGGQDMAVVGELSHYLQSVHGFRDNNITTLPSVDKTGHDTVTRLKPVRANIIHAIRELVRQTNPGDAVFFAFVGERQNTSSCRCCARLTTNTIPFLFSLVLVLLYNIGRGGRVRVKQAQMQREDDRIGLNPRGSMKEEALYPADLTKAGAIGDEELYNILVQPMPEGVHMTCLVDCSVNHTSAVGMHLPYRFHANNEQAKHYIPATLRVLFACESETVTSYHHHHSHPARDRTTRGLCTEAFLRAMHHTLHQETGGLSWASFLAEMQDAMLEPPPQHRIPQLASSRVIDVKKTNVEIIPNDFTGTKRAILIGINYEGRSDVITELDGCHRDVLKMKNFLVHHLGFSESNCTILMDDGEHRMPTRGNMMDSFRQLVQQTQPGDVVFVHYSGHGGQLEDQLLGGKSCLASCVCDAALSLF